ncbi:MAG: acyl-CoA dehydrogenase family protein [Actinobacteria bacterium]|nr:acyl-CoA dehydrogenase family protein [Actinomycetota bacterium]MBU1943353.1 acyl-CoA dehydrogenase family protein [Actinomycetota bacterium]MBU2686529.1 acyl-CoA dehydrogenase family protein [Actinomycetota bacterium]
MLSFDLSEEQALVKETIAGFANDMMDPLSRECDESGEVSGDLVKTGWELEIIPSCVPEEYGGFGEGASALTGAIAYEELAHGDLSTALHIVSPTVMAYTVLLYGTDEQKKMYLPVACGEAFTPAAAALVEPRYAFCPSQLTTSAVRDGEEYILNGSKCLVPLAGEADNLLVFASTNPGMGFAGVDAFIVPKGAEGVSVGERELNMGLKALATYEVGFKDAKVPLANKVGGDRGIDFMDLISRSRLALAAMAIGMMRRAAEHSRDYAKERIAFGDPIGSRQAIAFMVAEMFMETDASRMLLWEAAWKCDKGEDFAKDAAMAKNYAAEKCMKVCDGAVQVMGGHGYVRDNMPELWFRNARAFSALEGLVMV